MWKALFSSILIFVGLMHPTQSSQFGVDETYTGSVFSPARNALYFQIERNFSLKTTLSKTEMQGLVAKAIGEANPRHEDLEEANAIPTLSQQLVRTASCYGIDPVIFTGLVWRESNFKPRVSSETGATGLTQMTRQGIGEVLDRLSPISHRRLGHLRSLVKLCNPHFLDRVPPKASADTLAAWKNSVNHSTEDALVMGALLLKINLASVSPANAVLNRVGYYRNALERYNGDPKVKLQFATDVLLLAKRMIALPEVALNDSKFVSLIEGI